MRKLILSRCLAATMLSLLGQAAAADEVKSTYIDLTGSAGYSSNPFPGQNGGNGSPFASLSARLSHRWSSERTSTQIAGYWEGSDYVNDRLRNLLSFRGQTRHAVNERLDLSAAAGLIADFSGQLANRFLDFVPPGQPDAQPPVPGSPTDLYMYGGRELRGDGNLGLAWQASERSQLMAGVGVSRAVFSQSGLRDHTIENASIGYQRSVSQRTDAGFHMVVSRTEYDDSNDSTLIVGPAVTLRSHLSQDWTIAGSVGASFSKVRRVGRDSNSISPSFSASLCHEDSAARLCATAAHHTQSSAVAELITATTAGLEWTRMLDAKQTIELSAEYMHYDHPQAQITPIQSDQYRAAVTYSRLLSNRLSMGAEASARDGGRGAVVGQATRGSDVSVSLFLRYRWGDRA